VKEEALETLYVDQRPDVLIRIGERQGIVESQTADSLLVAVAIAARKADPAAVAVIVRFLFFIVRPERETMAPGQSGEKEAGAQVEPSAPPVAVPGGVIVADLQDLAPDRKDIRPGAAEAAEVQGITR